MNKVENHKTIKEMLLECNQMFDLCSGRTVLAAANVESQTVTDDTADDIMERIVRSATQSPRERAEPRERRRSRANRKSRMLTY